MGSVILLWIKETEKSSRGENMELFEFYKKIEEYQNQKNNILATVLEGENSGSRYFLSEGELIAAYGDGAIPDEQLKEIAKAEQSRITESDGPESIWGSTETAGTSGDLRSRTCFAAGDPACKLKWVFYVTVLEDRPEFCRRSKKNGRGSGDL